MNGYDSWYITLLIICIFMCHFSLLKHHTSQTPHYEAISYAWQDVFLIITSKVLLPNQQIFVNSPSETALDVRNSFDDDGWVWERPLVPVHDACTDVVLKKYAENANLKSLRKGNSGILLLPTLPHDSVDLRCLCHKEFAPKRTPFVVILEMWVSVWWICILCIYHIHHM